MFAECALHSGDVALSEAPSLQQQRLRGRSRVLSCALCGASLGEPGAQLARLHVGGRGTHQACRRSCGASFCDEACEAAAEAAGHALTCASSSSARRFRAAALGAGHQVGEACLLAAQLLAFLSTRTGETETELRTTLAASQPYAATVALDAGVPPGTREWFGRQLDDISALWLEGALPAAAGLDVSLLTQSSFQRALTLAASPRAYLTCRRTRLGSFVRSLRDAEMTAGARVDAESKLRRASSLIEEESGGDDGGSDSGGGETEGSDGEDSGGDWSEADYEQEQAPLSVPHLRVPHLRCTALFPKLPTVRHSCCPNCVLAFDDTAGAALCGTLRACCDVEVGEELTRAWVDARLPLRDRAAALAELGADVCTCDLCAMQQAEEEEDGGGQGGEITMAAVLAIAARAATRGAHQLAETACRYLLRYSEGDTGEASHGLACALLGLGRWHEASRFFAVAAAKWPHHAALNSIAATHTSYPPAPLLLGSACPPPLFEALDAGNGRHLTLSTLPCLSAAQCAAMVAEAEAFSHARGGWTTARHHSVPTTDLPLSSLPGAMATFNEAMARCVAPLAAASYPWLRGQLRVHDAFLVRYDANGGQASLPPHRDQGQLSMTLSLSAGEDFEGGGTSFKARGGAAVTLQQGGLLLFPSHLVHGGVAITSGRRYIIAAFLWIEDAP